MADPGALPRRQRAPLAAYGAAPGAENTRLALSSAVAATALALTPPLHAQVPLPADLALDPPAAALPPLVAAFSGGWGHGAWGGILATALVVERLAPDGAARVVYAVAASEQFGTPAWAGRIDARIEAGRLAFAAAGGARVEFEPDGSGRLLGRYTHPAGWQTRAWLERVPGDAAEVAAALERPIRPPWEEVRIALRSALGATAGQNLALRGFLYRSPLPGPRPLVILSHGSTDGERPGVVSIQPFEAQARFCLARGWHALAFMRKGRGGSDGQVLEEIGRAGTPDEDTQLESALEDLHAAVTQMRGQPFVDVRRVVLVGHSRGGLLSVAYAGRHADAVAGVLNFAGGWWSEAWDRGGFNRRQAALAGTTARAPMLWLYGERDSYYGVAFVRRSFAAFQNAGGRGDLVTFPEHGHGLIGWTELWGPRAGAFLDAVEARAPD
jgi:dienelactone hydrolase